MISRFNRPHVVFVESALLTPYRAWCADCKKAVGLGEYDQSTMARQLHIEQTTPVPHRVKVKIEDWGWSGVSDIRLVVACQDKECSFGMTFAVSQWDTAIMQAVRHPRRMLRSAESVQPG